MKEQRIALYIRLSMADEDTGKGKDESNSIVNQRNFINRFLDNHAELSKSPRTEFVDDGFSGTNTARPAFQNMVRQIREGKFNVCITKDFSRFSRDYIEIGDYLECLFPFLHVRYISINDGYDSKEYKGTTGGLEMVMRNIVYAAYSKDLSAKIVAGRTQSWKKGRRASGSPAYGYMADPDRKTMDIIDPEAAAVVRKIFNLAIEGKKAGQIARILNDEKIPTPSEYHQMKYPESKRYRNLSGMKRWDYNAVVDILKRYAYTGASVGHTKKRVVPCETSYVRVKKEDHIIVPGMHEAIVTVEEFEAAQKVMKKIKSNGKTETGYPLRSLVFCGNCGRHMAKKRSTGRSWFYCQHGRYEKESGCKKIRSSVEAELEKIVFEAIQGMIRLADDKQVRSKLSKTKAKAIMQSNTESVADLRHRMEKLKKEKLKAYEKYTMGKLDREAYIDEKSKLDGEISECEKSVQEKEEESEKLDNSVPEIDSELETAVSLYKEADCLTSDMVRAFIEKIIVYQEERIEIKWRFKDCFLGGDDEEK